MVRHLGLSPEQLARYEPGKPVTEYGFPYSTLEPDGIDPQFVSNQNTGFQIVSKTGKPVGAGRVQGPEKNGPGKLGTPSGTAGSG